MWRKTLREMGKTGSKTFPKSCIKLAKTAPFYRAKKIAVEANPQARWHAGRPVDQPTVIFMTVGTAGRPHDRPHPGLDLSVGWSVDWGKIQRAELSGRSTVQSTGPQAKARARFCAHRSTARRQTSSSVDRSVDRQKARSENFGD